MVEENNPAEHVIVFEIHSFIRTIVADHFDTVFH
jgi:hypothetical protein